MVKALFALFTAAAANVETAKPNIVELAQSVDDLSTLVTAVVAADLADTLSSPGPFTVFAPTNEAFGSLPAGTLDSLLKPENKAELADILTFHVLPEQVLSTDLKAFQRVPTVEGKHLDVIKSHNGVHVGADIKSLKKVTGADNLASNGVAHIIDGVMLPPSHLGADKPNIVELAQSVDDLSTLVTAVVAADLAGTLSSPGPFTVFAPTNEAFGALPAGTLDSLLKPENKAQLADILTFHVLPEQVLSTDLKVYQRVATVEGKHLDVIKTTKGVHVGADIKSLKKVTGADNLASNGVAHIIDGVMLPPSHLGADKPNIVELAQSVDDLSTLVTAVVAADLADTLSSPGPFTVFAPTNEAFAALPAGTLDSLLKPENKAQLADILTFHVLPEQVLSTDLKAYQRVATVEGKHLDVIKTTKGVHVGADIKSLKKVTGADNLASNGVAHIIDGVMLPPSHLGADKPNIVELAQSVDDLSTLVTAVVAADLADTLSSPGPFTVFAPTNEAFAALPAGTLDSLLKPENKAELADILTFHVLPEQVLSTDLKEYQRVATVEGKHLDVIKSHKGVFVGADVKSLKHVTGADNLASNGVAHIIDGVMLPPAAIMV